MSECIEVTYEEERWDLLRSLRGEAATLMHPLASIHVDCIAYGSLARGDVKPTSDVDIFIPNPPAPELVEAALEREGVRVSEREIVQATPGYAAKGYIYTKERRGFSFPLVSLLPAERDFYGFAGSIYLKQLEENLRVPGVDKRLMLIEPTKRGHVESHIAGREGEVARLLSVDSRIVRERIRTLERRRSVGRTGVYLKYSLEPNEGFGEALHRLSLHRPAVRKRLG
ncbi:MAG: nucleotidyltransferase domain-containing protein [Candidatus Bathyarchaeota archaeon]|nr:nucleotidyltransferase domain-containing protein [Candidatus Bathyarchaeota archaeon]